MHLHQGRVGAEEANRKEDSGGGGVQVFRTGMDGRMNDDGVEVRRLRGVQGWV